MQAQESPIKANKANPLGPDTLQTCTARLVVKNSFLELVESSPKLRARRVHGTKSESDLPCLYEPYELPHQPSGLSDDETDVETGSSPDYDGEEEWDTEAGSSSGQEARGKSTPRKEYPKVEIPLPHVSPSDLEALPALSAAAAAAAFDAAGIQPEVLRSLLQEQQRFAGVAQTEVPAPSGPVGPKTAPPLVISVSEALGTTEGSGVSTPKTPKKTTVMLRNLPNNYTRSMVLNLLNQEGFKGKFDFLYLPIDFRSKAGLGYAFVNLVEPSFVPSFWKAFDGYTKWVLPSSKVCQVSWSGPHQGQKAHVDRYRSSPIMHGSVPDEYKPIVLQHGERIPFPEATKKIRAPRHRK